MAFASDAETDNDNSLIKSTTAASVTDETTTVGDTDSASDENCFVEYVPPPEAKILPPAKYKLWLIIFVLVYFASWVSDEADFLEFLRFDGWLSPEASLFLRLAVIVFVLVYSTLDLITSSFSIQTKEGNEYGMGAWLKQPRATFFYKHENILFEILARIVHILEEGFSMFDSPQIPANNKTKEPPNFECPDKRSCIATLRIEHRVDPKKLPEYQKWVRRIQQAVKEQNGLLAVEANKIQREWDEEEGQSPAASKGEEAAYANLHVIYVKFANTDYLNDWMLSPRRRALIKALKPLLVEPDVVKIQGSRELPDCFSDLLVRQSQAVPKKPPRKWKVWWLTVVALFITTRWTDSFMPYYFDQWGLTDADARVERLVGVFISTFLNSYVLTPLFLFIFDHWLHHSDVKVKNTREPWKTLDEGVEWLWPKILLTFAFYGGCVIAMLAKRYS